MGPSCQLCSQSEHRNRFILQARGFCYVTKAAFLTKVALFHPRLARFLARHVFLVLTFVYVFPNYPHVLVSVWPAMFMPKSNHVTYFMNHHVMILAAKSNRDFPTSTARLAHCAVTAEHNYKESIIRGL